MAATAGTRGTKVRDNSDITKVNSVPHYICCQHLQQELETVLLELHTTKKIIELLHEETNSTVQHIFTNSQSGNTSSVSSAIHSDFSKKNATDIWNTGTYTRRKHIKQPVVQQQQPIPTIVNRYVLPNFHHEDPEDPQSSNSGGEKTSVKPRNSFISKPRKNKILIIGDSHARGCAANLSSLNETFEVMGTVMPGPRLEHITNLARREISHLDRNDYVVIGGGTNDISRNESHAGLRHMRKFALQNKHTNIIAVTPPHRHNLPDFSCVNKDTNLTRDKFTWHGLHMSPSGREKMAKII
jgi:hypothetical protein